MTSICPPLPNENITESLTNLILMQALDIPLEMVISEEEAIKLSKALSEQSDKWEEENK